jgi:hypothetical protein
MDLLVAQYTPLFLAVIAVGLGVIYSNSRITDIKDLIRSEANAVRSEIGRVEVTIRGDVGHLEQRMDRLDERMDRLEGRMDRFERIMRS